ncbi:unnamed protein product [Microthlaspi erraticum]|uniref:DUF4283 domain-containing protein n=1 Tax=Microthlaspi erraticum TaxID=1685480 RepID=A0A6D2JWR7_9BRAS|nr:unnamed protein product [Microthlaspi erraticum]
MKNPWFLNGRASALNPVPPSAGEGLLPPPLLPPDPPDPSALSSSQFPPLSPPGLSKPRSSPQTALPKKPVVRTSGPSKPSTADVVTAQRTQITEAVDPQATLQTSPLTTVPGVRSLTVKPITADAKVTHPTSTDVEMMQAPLTSQPSSHSPLIPPTLTINCENTVQKTLSPEKTFTIIPPKTSSPIHSNKVSSTSPPAIPTAQISLPQQKPNQVPLDPRSTIPNNPNPSLVDRIKVFEDKSLQQLAPVSFSDNGIPRVRIPDEVFQQGAKLHKDFIICYFNGRAPPYSQIQSVLNHMWGKGRKLEIHNNPLTRYSELMAKEGPEVMIGDGPEGDRSNRMAKQARRNRALSKRKQSA